MKVKVYPSFDEIKTETDAGVQVTIKGQGEVRLLYFDKPVRLIEINKWM